MRTIHSIRATASLAMALLCGLITAQANAESFRDTAVVTDVIPQFRTVNQPRQECWTEQVSTPVQPQRNNAAPILGAITGGLIGSTLGKGGGRDAAIGVGAATGAIVGDRLGNEGSSGGYQTQNIQHCRQIDNLVQVSDGYLVKFQFNGKYYQTVLPYDPGKTLDLNVSLSPILSR